MTKRKNQLTSPDQSRRKLRRSAWLFFIVLILPVCFLVNRAYQQLQVESFIDQRNEAEKLSSIIDVRFQNLIEHENQRTFEAYRYLDVAKGKTQISELATMPEEQELKGLIGYFQINVDGVFNSPLLPQTESELSHPLTKLTREDYLKREKIVNQCYTLLKNNAFQDTWAQNQQPLVNNYKQLLDDRNDYSSITSLGKSPLFSRTRERKLKEAPKTKKSDTYLSKDDFGSVPTLESMDAVQELTPSTYSKKSKRVSELNLDNRLQKIAEVPEVSLKEQVMPQKSRLSQLNVVLEEKNEVLDKAKDQLEDRLERKIFAFAGEVNPFRFEVLNSGEFVFFRNVWKHGQRTIQGFLVNPEFFLEDMLTNPLKTHALNNVIHLVAGLNDEVVYSTGVDNQIKQDLFLLKNYLSSPFQKLELIFSLSDLPAHSGQQLLNIVVILFILVLIVGIYGIYRIGLQQINLAQQHHDFVASVSHELKTPLTSIRMYGEMLRSDWVNEEKIKSYYDFIFYESERLSRLINNVLQLSKLSGPKSDMELNSHGPAQLIDLIQSKVSTQVEASKFELKVIQPESPTSQQILINEDAFSQIMINLVDNALKFSKDFTPKVIELGYRTEQKQVVFFVRDYGPGITKEQEKKVFQLFYRLENELTRKTQGTGIGLALVLELATRMQAHLKIHRKEQGVEMCCSFLSL